MSRETTSSAAERILAEHEQRNLRIVTVARTVIFLVIFVWLGFNYGWDIALDHAPVLGLFILNGLVLYRTVKGHNDRGWVAHVTLLVDILLLAFTLLYPGNTYPDQWPWQTVLRQPSFIYFFILLTLASMSFRPALILWAGGWTCVVWGIATWIIVTRSDAITLMPGLGNDSLWREQLERYLHPNYVHIDDAFVRIFVTMLVTLILARAAVTVRRLLEEQAETVRERANLARYVAPSMVDALARADRPLGEVRSHEVAVLFADIQGFTHMAEGRKPDEIMAFLRRFHATMAELVFAHDGTLDKFMGDGVMATFGTPHPRADDCARAVACGRAMLEAMSGWDEAGDEVRIGVGIHYGLVTMGDVGGAQRFEFAVIGDTVNVASRLEHATRALGASMLVSRAVIDHLDDPSAATGAFRRLGVEQLRGRDGGLEVWGLATADNAAQDAAK